MLPTKTCTGCAACDAACANKCISMSQDRDGFYRPVIAQDQCVRCGRCEDICPVLNHKAPAEIVPTAIAAYAESSALRHRSSSGGLFSVLAEAILRENGAVCGAALTEDLSVEHIVVRDPKELSRLRGSKYVQSRMGNCLQLVKSLLIQGIPVLFSGTPCQVEGLLAYLGKDYDCLYTIDLICHGVPSEKVWKSYLRCREKEAGSPVATADFRSKSSGWHSFSMELRFQNGSIRNQTIKEDPYMKAFLNNLCLRESCYQCSFKSLSRRSDLTLGDFWGIETLLPELDNAEGVSVAFIQSEKGQRLLDRVASELCCHPADAEEAAKKNGAMLHSCYRHPFRDYFFLRLTDRNFDRLTASCLTPGLLLRLRRKAAQLAKQVNQ